MAQEQHENQTGGVVPPTASGYEVPEGKGEFINRNSLLLFIGQAISLVGDGFYAQTVITWVVAILLTGAKTSTALAAASLAVAVVQVSITLAGYLANVVVVPFAGVFVDRWNRKTVMVVTNVVQAVIALVPLAAFYATDRSTFLLMLYISYFLLTLAAGFFSAAELGGVQVIVSRRRVPQAISSFQFLTAIGVIFGVLSAPAFFATYGAVIAISFNALSFLVSAIFIFFLNAPRQAFHPYAFQLTESPESVGIGVSIKRVLKELRAGFAFVIRKRVLLALVIMLVVSEIGAGAVNGLYSAFYLTNLHGTDIKLLGLLPAAITVGLLIGSVVTAILATFMPLKYINTSSVILVGVLLLLFAYQTTLVFGVAIFLIVGLFNGIFQVSAMALIAKASPKHLIGRSQSSITSLLSISAAVATFVIVSVVTGLSTAPSAAKAPAGLYTAIFLASGVLIAIGGMIGLLLVRGAQEDASDVVTPAVIGITGATGTAGD